MNSDTTASPTVTPVVVQVLVFSLVGAAFTTIYITQPVLPVIRGEFDVSATYASITISAVILGIALSNLPLGMAADRYPIRPIIVIGGTIVALCALVCASTGSISVLIGARFIQGLFIPCLTTCLAAYLSRTLPMERLNVVMGSYISATVAGGLGSRLLGGFFDTSLSWRYAFVTASVLVLVATFAAYWFLPREGRRSNGREDTVAFLHLIANTELLRIFVVAFSSFFVFSSIFNYMPFYLETPPMSASTELVTALYLAYLIGMVMGPCAGALSNRIGNGGTMALGAAVFGISTAITFIQSIPVIAASLAGICAGFFAIHASAAGALNRRLNSSLGRANSLYVLSYYLGGFTGISVSGYAYAWFDWTGLVALQLTVLLIPFGIGMWEVTRERVTRR